MTQDKKKKKNNQFIEIGKKDVDENTDKKKALSDFYLDKIKESFNEFNKMSPEERINIYGDKKFMDQFWEFFKENYSDLLTYINKEDLPLCLKELEKKGFTLSNIIQNAEQLHEHFKENDSELHVMQTSLKKFGNFCKENINNIPYYKYEKFAQEMGFDPETGSIDPDTTKLKTIDDLRENRNKFVEKEDLTLKEFQKNNIKKILLPNYNPTERIIIKITLSKIRKLLKGKLREQFDENFDLEVNALSKIQTLTSFKNARINFLETNAKLIDQDLAKKFDEIKVTNGEIKNELLDSGRPFEANKSFDEREQHFKIIFNKLATRQLFEEVKNKQKLIDHYTDIIIDGMKGFPPYVNEIFKIYPYTEEELFHKDPGLSSSLNAIDEKIIELENNISDRTKDNSEKIYNEINALKEKKAKLKREAYIKLLNQKNQKLGGILKKLINTHFDFSQLNKEEQQIFTDILIKKKLEDLIEKKAPELLSVNKNALSTFVHDLFDLQKMEIKIPTYAGMVHLKFSKKEFFSEPMGKLLSIEELSELKNLPLMFEILLTPSNEEFFEKGILFQSFFEEFHALNGNKTLADSYKVRITKNGKSVEGYLSRYSPIGEKNVSKIEEAGGNVGDPEIWYLYTHPITSPSEDRELVTWDGTDSGDPVFIKTEDEGSYHVDILEKKLHLNGEGIGALLSSFILGQQNPYENISEKEKKRLQEKFNNLKTYKDINTLDSSKTGEEKENTNKENTETKNSLEENYKNFLETRSQLGGSLDTKDPDKGFCVGAKILVKTGSTKLPPYELGGDAWMWLEISNINKQKGTFEVKVHGGELSLGNLEGKSKELPLDISAFSSIKEGLADNGIIYTFPKIDGKFKRNTIFGNLKKSSNTFQNMFKHSFDQLTRNANKNTFTFANGDYMGEEVEYFGYDQIDYTSTSGGKTDTQTTPIYFKIKYNPDGTVTVSNHTKFIDETSNKEFFYKQTMDPVMFALFIGSKTLEPKPKDIVKKSRHASETPDQGYKKKSPFFSIKNVLGFFSGTINKIKDSIKKYDEEKTDDLTDIMLNNGKILEKIGLGLGGIFQRVGYSIERAGMEYYTERDNRIRRKIERWQKIYEKDPHFPSLISGDLKKITSGKVRVKDIYKVPAILLALINIEKSPYSRHPEMMGKGMRVNLILGQNHQKRFLAKLNKYQDEVKENAERYGSGWTVYMNEEIVKMEMKYIVGVIDGREDSVDPEHEKAQAGKRSRTFANKLDEAMRTKFGFTPIESKYKEIPKTTRFEFAEYEYNRNIASNKIAAAMPYFKVMAEQAQTPQQFSIFQMHVIVALMSGWWRNHTDANTKGRIKDITRTAGILTGQFAKDPFQQSKIFRLLQIYSNGTFGSTKCGLSGEGFKLGGKTFESVVKSCTSSNMEIVGEFVKQFKDWRINKGNGTGVMKFLSFEGKNKKGKNITELINDPSISHEDKTLLKEYLGFALEGTQDIDSDIRHNFVAMGIAPFAKSQTIVRELMKFERGEFSGKDSNDKGGSEMFWTSVANNLPKSKINSFDVIFYLKKFFNWFGNNGFDGNDRTIFIKRLAAIQKMYQEAQSLSEPQKSQKIKEADDTLWYTVNGVILNGGPGRGNPPAAFESALEAFKNFFKTNLNTILHPDVIVEAFGNAYLEDSKKPYEVGNWAKYIELNDQASLFGVTGEERKQKIALRQKLKSQIYIHEELFRLAESLNRSHGIENLFKKYYNPVSGNKNSKKESTKEQLTNNLTKGGIKIKNKDTAIKLKNLLGKKDNHGNILDPDNDMVFDMEENNTIFDE